MHSDIIKATGFAGCAKAFVFAYKKVDRKLAWLQDFKLKRSPTIREAGSFGEEQYSRNIPLIDDRSFYVNPDKSIFSTNEI
ncbi:MAG: hypothetical protein IPH11_10255 [Ignavibacteriales bacterium]|nr:hypothetical protein [Ignavibacteriales bacterium]